MENHEIDYRIFGEELQCVEIELDPMETVIAESGSLMYMESDIRMQTLLGDGSQKYEGVLSKLFSAGKRLITGESLFMTAYTHEGSGKKTATFAAPYPGKIIPFNLMELGGKIICQKQSFLCAAKGVVIGVEFQKRLGVGFFGGEGFIMQSLQGDGMAFVHAGGTIIEKQLKPEEVIKVDTGCVVALSQEIDYDIQYVGGIRNTLFGGEGVFFAKLTGPGKVWLQSLPFSRLADKIFASAPKSGGKRTGEGSIIGTLGHIIDGNE